MLQEIVPLGIIPFRKHAGISACHLFPILLPPETDRKKVMDAMKERGIQTSIHYPPIHHFEAYRIGKQEKLDLRITEDVAVRELSLPLYPAMTDDDVELVVRAVQDSLREQ